MSSIVDIGCIVSPESVYQNIDGGFGNYLEGICSSTEFFINSFVKPIFLSGLYIGAAYGFTKFFHNDQNSSTI